MVRRSQSVWQLFTSESARWILCFISMLALAYINKLGSLGAALFIAPWVLVFLARPKLAIDSVIRNAWLLLIPALAMLSAIWSDYPMETVRHSLEFLVTVLIAIWASSCIKPKTYISVLFFTGLAVMTLSVLFGAQGIDGATGEYVLMGIFASKNQLALYASILILTTLSITFDKSRSSSIRFFSVGALLPALWALIVSRSMGSIVFCIASIIVVVILQAVSLLPSRARALFFIICFILSVPLLTGAMLAFDDLDSVLALLGKDASLTGRTELWESALNLIQQRPVLGLGFNAFWHIGNPEAERLWYLSHVEPGSGFNFHNLYLNTAVELGLAGVLALISLFVSIAMRLIAAIIFNPEPHHFFAAGIFAYVIMISPLEAYFLYEFHLGIVLIATCWCFSKPRAAGARSPAAARLRTRLRFAFPRYRAGNASHSA